MTEEASEGDACAGKSKSEDGIAAGQEELKIRAEEDVDAVLFGPPPPRAECPICMLPMPADVFDTTYMLCCGKEICGGCLVESQRVIRETNATNAKRNRDQGRAPVRYSCAFCREPIMPTTHEEKIERLQKRMELDDAVAFNEMAGKYMMGDYGLPKNERKAFELYLRAAELDCAEACVGVSLCYQLGQGVEKDEEKYRMYLEKGAKAGNARARHDLGVLEYNYGHVDLAVKHFLISASAGWQHSLDSIKSLYKVRKVSKDDFEDALRSSFAAKKEGWSKERDKWAAEKARLGL